MVDPDLLFTSFELLAALLFILQFLCVMSPGIVLVTYRNYREYKYFANDKLMAIYIYS